MQSVNVKRYITKEFGPIPVGHRVDDKCFHMYGFGRTVKLTIGFHPRCVESASNIFDAVFVWLNNEWKNRILISRDDPLLNEAKTFSELGSMNIRILPRGYDASLYSSCKYIYDNINDHMLKQTNYLPVVQLVEIYEHMKTTVEYSCFPSE